MRCVKCGEISDSKFCPNCGAKMPVTRYASLEEDKPELQNQGNKQQDEKMKNSTLSIVALIFSITLCLSPIGIILAIIDLCRKDKAKKHDLAVAALTIGIMAILVSYLCSALSGKGIKNKQAAEQLETQSEENKYTSDSIDVVSSNPDAYKGKYITFNACSVNKIDEDGDSAYYQFYTSPDYTNSVIVEAPKDVIPDAITDDYVIVDGKIEGKYSGQTIVGVDKDWAYITADSITPSTYTDTFGKADTTWDFSDRIISQNGVDVQITKVEFNSTETRVYITVTNNSSDTFNIFAYNAKLIQNGQQYETTSNYYADYPELSSDILPGASSSGVIVFPVVDQSSMQLHIEGSSDNWEIEFQPFEFELSNQ